MRVLFLSDPAYTSPVATATANVLVAKDGTLQKPDGTSLGTISVDSNVVALSVADTSPIEIGESVEPGVSAYTTDGLVALAPGAVTFSVTSGGSYVQANANGTVTGLSAGTATVVPSVDGVTGTSGTVTVLPAAVAVRTIEIASNDLRYDATRNRLWLAVPPTTAGGNSVQSLDVASGNLGSPISLGAEPTSLAISDDGSRMYVGFLTASSIRPIDLATETAMAAFALPNDQNGPTIATDLAVQPGHAETVAVAPAEGSFTPVGLSPVIFDSGVPRPNGNVYASGNLLLWASASRIYDYTNDSNASVYSYDVDSQGVTANSFRGGINNDYLRLVAAGGLLYNRNGSIFDATNFNRVGSFAFSTTNFFPPAVDLTRKRAYFLQISANLIQIHAFDTDTRVETSVHRLGVTGSLSDGSEIRLTRVGTNGLAFRLQGKVVLLDDVSGY